MRHPAAVVYFTEQLLSFPVLAEKDNGQHTKSNCQILSTTCWAPLRPSQTLEGHPFQTLVVEGMMPKPKTSKSGPQHHPPISSFAENLSYPATAICHQGHWRRMTYTFQVMSIHTRLAAAVAHHSHSSAHSCRNWTGHKKPVGPLVNPSWCHFHCRFLTCSIRNLLWKPAYRKVFNQKGPLPIRWAKPLWVGCSSASCPSRPSAI